MLALASLRRALPPLFLALAATACTTARSPRQAPTGAPIERVEPGGPAAERTLPFLLINDVYRIEGVEDGQRGGLARLRTLREELEREHPDLLVVLAGDFLYPSFLSRTYGGEQMVDVLNLLDGAAGVDDPRFYVTFGNHEFDADKPTDAAGLQARIEQSEFTWLDTNVDFTQGADGRPSVAARELRRSVIYPTRSGLRVGLFSLTTPEKKPSYVATIEDPEETARATVAELRRHGADVVVAVTHLPVSEDMGLLRDLGANGPDLILGGHDHQHQAHQVDGRWVLKGDADAVTAVVGTLRVDGTGHVQVDHRFVSLGPDAPARDPVVEHAVDGWLARHGELYCRQHLGRGPGCLEDRLGSTRVRLGAEELEIRRFETNLGDWVADRMRDAFPEQRVDAAFLNSGSLRLNYDIPAGTVITRRYLEELFAYPAPLVLLDVDGKALAEVASRAVEDWTGNGWFLQVSGLAFDQDPATQTASDLTLLNAAGPRPVEPGEHLHVATIDFLAEGGDGYTMLPGATVLARGPDLREEVVRALAAAEPEGIAPRVEGRICNPQRPGPCLAVRDR